MEGDQEQAERENRAVPIGGQLGNLLTKIQAKRDARTPEEIERDNHPLPSVQRVNSLPAKKETPITKAELARLLGPLEVVYGSRQLSEAETRTKYQTFYAILGHLPERDVRLAVERYVKCTDPVFEFFPKPAQLLKLSKF
jgi:hypothetical protein